MEIKNIIKVIILGLLINAIVSFKIYAQENEGGIPLSFRQTGPSRARLSIPTYTTSDIPHQRLQAEDAITDQGKFPYRFGYNFNVNLDIKKEGILQEQPDGTKLWTYRIECPKAISINFLYNRFKLPEGAKLYLYNQDKSITLGAYTKRNNQETGRFGTETIAGDLVTLEYSEPATVEFPGELVVGVIVHGYRTHASSLPTVLSAGSCNVNINCPEAVGWENEKRAVARIIMNGNTLCSGTLINNARNDDKPYFMTANHCIGDLDAVSKPDASGWVFYWNYESATCSGNSGPETQTTAGATVRANNDQSDFALVELKSKPAASYNVFYAGWNRSNTPANGAVGIHHPAGDIKKFSKDNSTMVDDAGHHWRVPSWDIGVTEGGSSGSGLFDFNKRFIGQLTGGASGCDVSVDNLWDSYGKFWYSWDQGGTIAQRRLKDWLDPDNSGIITINGKISGNVSNNPPTITITAPSDNSAFTAPATLNIAARANDIDGTISKVEFFNGTVKLGEDLTAPFTFSWSVIAAGSYTISAKATDNKNASSTSSPITIVVKNAVNKNPSVAITAPSSGSSFNAPATVTITANASDVDGFVTKVEFFNGSSKLGEDPTAPYSYTWPGIPAGTYSITAKVTDNTNAIVTSSAVSITVTTPADKCANVAQYIENGGYVPGSKVKNAGRQFECKPWPYSGWCNAAAWAYAPGTGTYWTDAWVDAGSCSKSIGVSTSEEETDLLVISPNPTDNTVTIDFKKMNQNLFSIQIFDSYGHEILSQEVISGNKVDLSSLASGIYSLMVIADGEVLTKKIIKK